MNLVWSDLGAPTPTVIKPDGSTAVTQPDQKGYALITDLNLADGTSAKGQVWELKCQRDCHLLNIPPQLARSPREILIQQSVIESDGLPVP